MPEESENYIHIPVRDASDFVSGSFRTIDIASERGIKAVIGKLKSDPQGSTHVQKYLFDKSKDWTMEKAQAWVKEHESPEKAMKMERKSFPFEIERKKLDAELRTFKGYAAVTGILDDGGDVIDSGAFEKSLRREGHRVKIFYIHEFNQPIGKPIELREVNRSHLPKSLIEKWPGASGGLFVHGRISDTSLGNDVLTLMRDGVLDELSIGYTSIKEDVKQDDFYTEGVRHLQEIKLMDVSLVPLAMNPAAILTEVKRSQIGTVPSVTIGMREGQPTITLNLTA